MQGPCPVTGQTSPNQQRERTDMSGFLAMPGPVPGRERPGPEPSPQYGPAWVADCYGVTVDTMRGDLLSKIDAEAAPVTAEMIRNDPPDNIARTWAIEQTPGGVTLFGLLDSGQV